ncbi:hypothetical protein ACSQ67_013592 [Phaseolus vulgaris]
MWVFQNSDFSCGVQGEKDTPRRSRRGLFLYIGLAARHGHIIFLSITLWIQRRRSEPDEAAAFLDTIFLNNSSCTTTPEEKEKPAWNTMQVSSIF